MYLIFCNALDFSYMEPAVEMKHHTHAGSKHQRQIIDDL